MAVGHALQVVVVWVLRHAAIEEGPGEVIHRVLLVLHRLGHYLSIEVVMQEVVQVGLDEGGEGREGRGGEGRGGEGREGRGGEGGC